MKYLLTTSNRPTKELATLAKNLSRQFNIPYKMRNIANEKLKNMEIDFIYVLDRNYQLKIQFRDSSFFFHPSTAKVRRKNILNGQNDNLIECMKLKGNELILDTTFGLGSEALLLAHYLNNGRVVGLESSIHIFRIVSHGLKHYPFKYQWISEAATHIVLLHKNFKHFIRKITSNSYDIVYCDPMFEVPQFRSDSINPLRYFADYEQLSRDDVKEFMRIAKKRIVLKSRTTDNLFNELDIDFSYYKVSKNSGVIYGVIES
ncbi:MAG: class I SAM-dependent methyltransferase [Kosmotogaceae bacterium]